MQQRKFLFIDRDGTIIEEPADEQIDSLAKLRLLPGVIPALLALQAANYALVMVTNQDGLGTESFPQHHFQEPHDKLLDLLSSQGITFDDILICPHRNNEGCDCRKPRVGLLLPYLREQSIDKDQSYVIGDRQTDLQLAENLGIQGILYGNDVTWPTIVTQLLQQDRTATVTRNTQETQITVTVDLDQIKPIAIQTGIGFFDHMLEQLAKHGGFSLVVSSQGDLHIDEHHTVEDTAIAIGQALQKALGDKRGIARYGFVLPMDEALAQVAIDLSGRAYCQVHGEFPRDHVGDMSTEMVNHFFQSFAGAMAVTMNCQVTGENTHHMVEALFKAVGRALRQAFVRSGTDLPSTKGVL